MKITQCLNYIGLLCGKKVMNKTPVANYAITF